VSEEKAESHDPLPFEERPFPAKIVRAVKISQEKVHLVKERKSLLVERGRRGKASYVKQGKKDKRGSI